MMKNDFFDKIEQAYSRNSSIEELKISKGRAKGYV